MNTVFLPWLKSVLHLIATISLLFSTLPLNPSLPPTAPTAPAALPVYRLIPISTDLTETARLARGFEEIAPAHTVSGTDLTTAGITRFTVADPQSGAVYQRLDQSGGFYAFNAARAFSETARGPFDPLTARLKSCQFLADHQLFPAEIAPGTADCSNPAALPYTINIAHATLYTPTRGLSQTVETAIIVHVPLAINVGGTTPNYIPLHGPGGHISLLFNSTDPQSAVDSLDAGTPGLSAVAAPWGTRRREPLGTFTLLSSEEVMQQARQKLQRTFPADARIYLGTPKLAYYADDPANPQANLEPRYFFTRTLAVIDGVTVTLRDFSLPAVVGFAPTVSLAASPFIYNRPLTFTAQIQPGMKQGTFTYALSLDSGEMLAAGTATDGPLTLANISLPALSKDGTPAPILVTLVVTDANQATAEASLALQPNIAPALYLPFTLKNAAARDINSPTVQPQTIALCPTRYRVGIEYIEKYNGVPELPDLELTRPDAVHFYKGLAGYGWKKEFNWNNNAAWEKDWRDCSLGGADCRYGVDRVDFVYFSGHGSPGQIYFGTYKDDTTFYGVNARYQTLRWVGFSSCETVQGGPVSAHPGAMDWLDAFQGAHMLLGFHSGMEDVDFGGPVAINMRIPRICTPGAGCRDYPELQLAIREAWVKTAFDTNAGSPGYVYAVGVNGVNPVDDRLPRGNDPWRPRPFPVSWYNWVWWE